jgi:SAM-dependent methyltransferase
MATIVSTRETQFCYFDEVLRVPNWKDSKILDFGGNVGGFLVDGGGRINHEDYWCLDLNQDVIERGSCKFPCAHFCHYNRYSSQYNPHGVRNLPVPDLGFKFDIILAFSVFTHTHRNEMLELVEQLRSMLAPRGVLAFTFTDPSYDRSISDPKLPSGTDVRKILTWQQATNPSLEIEDMVETARQSNWCLLVDDKLHIEPGNDLSNQEHQGKPWESYCSYFTVDYMRRLFPGAEVVPPVSPEWQHCCVLREVS